MTKEIRQPIKPSESLANGYFTNRARIDRVLSDKQIWITNQPKQQSQSADRL